MCMAAVLVSGGRRLKTCLLLLGKPHSLVVGGMEVYIAVCVCLRMEI